MNHSDQLSIEVCKKFVEDYWQPGWIDLLEPNMIDVLRHFIERGEAEVPLQHVPILTILHWLEIRGYRMKLVYRQRQLEYVDSYGDWVFDKWFEELKSFVGRKENDLWKELDCIPQYYRDCAKQLNCDHLFDYREWTSFFEVIERYTSKAMHGLPNIEKAASPEDFETSISERLSNIGWASRRTGRSGDQGADVVAEMDSVRLIIQCKLFDRPVGNSAVQEVFAARNFHSGTHAAVVASRGFTASARQLASSLGVDLVDDLYLEDYASRLTSI